MKAAQQATPEEVAEFISSIGLEQYSESFLEDEIDGNMMLNAKDCDLADIVESRLHQVKIIVLFKRRYFGKTPKRFININFFTSSSIYMNGHSCMIFPISTCSPVVMQIKDTNKVSFLLVCINSTVHVCGNRHT